MFLFCLIITILKISEVWFVEFEVVNCLVRFLSFCGLSNLRSHLGLCEYWVTVVIIVTITICVYVCVTLVIMVSEVKTS